MCVTRSEGFSDVLTEASCNKDCGCSTASYQPVCGFDNVQYFSPCHAGCNDLLATDGEFVSKPTFYLNFYLYIFEQVIPANIESFIICMVSTDGDAESEGFIGVNMGERQIISKLF